MTIRITTCLLASNLATIHQDDERVGFAERLAMGRWDAHAVVDGFALNTKALVLNDIRHDFLRDLERKRNAILSMSLTNPTVFDDNLAAAQKVRDQLADLDTFGTPFPTQGQRDSLVARRQIAEAANG